MDGCRVDMESTQPDGGLPITVSLTMLRHGPVCCDIGHRGERRSSLLAMVPDAGT